MQATNKRIAIVGGGPSALFLLGHLVETGISATIDIFERTGETGKGMPYSTVGAGQEHVTNVSPNEIPDVGLSVKEWIKSVPEAAQKQAGVNVIALNEYKVLPRLFFGNYLHAEFKAVMKKAKEKGVIVTVYLNTEVTDIIDEKEAVRVVTESAGDHFFDRVVIATGHEWPLVYENTVPGYYDSPYPPSKIHSRLNHSIAIRGSSLTAIDAVRTLARVHGTFLSRPDGMQKYLLIEGCKKFKITLYSIGGLLPGLRFHLENSKLQPAEVLTEQEIKKHIAGNGGFLSLDYIFEKNFKQPLKTYNQSFYERIKDMNMEEFIDGMMSMRESISPFQLFKAEYAEAEKSIQRKQSVHWKEFLAVLSFTMNYPAKYFSAEDRLRIQHKLKPLISVVIAFVPQSSAQELIALHDAGVLEVVAVDKDSWVEPIAEGGATVHFKDENNCETEVIHQTFIDAIGQRAFLFQQFPFKSLLKNKTITQAVLKFQSASNGDNFKKDHPEEVIRTDSGEYYLKVPGIRINDYFQVLDVYGAVNQRIFIMAVPYIAGYNPDYSGLDFCNEAAGKIAACLNESSL